MTIYDATGCTTGDMFRQVESRDRAGDDAWHEISEDAADYCLEVLPPIYVRGGFMVSEAWRHLDTGEPEYFGVTKIGTRYFARHMTRRTAPALITALRAHLAETSHVSA